MPPVSAISKLPESVRDELNRKLVESGFGNLVALSQWLSEQGYEIGKSTVGEYSLGLKQRMERSMAKARERMAIAKALQGTSDEDKAALMEANEMIAADQVMDMLEELADMDADVRLAMLPKLIRAIADLNRSAVGSAKWKREFETEIRKQAAAQAASTAKAAGVSEDTIARIRTEVLGMSS